MIPHGRIGMAVFLSSCLSCDPVKILYPRMTWVCAAQSYRLFLYLPATDINHSFSFYCLLSLMSGLPKKAVLFKKLNILLQIGCKNLLVFCRHQFLVRPETAFRNFIPVQ